MADKLDAKELRSFLEGFDPVARELAMAVRGLVLDVFPDAIETAEGKEIGYGFDRGYKGLVFALSLKKGGLNIGVAEGASLEDPDNLLRGTGKRHRHVPVVNTSDLSNPALRRLLERALESRRGEGRS